MTDTIKIDDKVYHLNDLSNEAMQAINNIKACDQELNSLRAKAAIAQVARDHFVKVLKAALPDQ